MNFNNKKTIIKITAIFPKYLILLKVSDEIIYIFIYINHKKYLQ